MPADWLAQTRTLPWSGGGSCLAVHLLDGGPRHGAQPAPPSSAGMSAPWMSREPFVLLEDEPAEDADTAEGQHHHRRHCSRREQLSAILAALASA